MSFKFECPHCGQRIAATIELIGTQSLCPSCNQAFTVPNPPEGKLLHSGNTSPNSARGNNGVGTILTLLRRRPREVTTLRRILVFGVCGSMAILGILGLAELGIATILWDHAGAAPTYEIAGQTLPPQNGIPSPNRGNTQRDIHQIAIRKVLSESLAAANSNPTGTNKRANAVEYYSLLSKINTTDCPDDFAEAWVRYMIALKECVNVANAQPQTTEEHLFFGFINGLNGELDGGTARSIREKNEVISKLDKAAGEVSAIAARYGVH